MTECDVIKDSWFQHCGHRTTELNIKDGNQQKGCQSVPLHEAFRLLYLFREVFGPTDKETQDFVKDRGKCETFIDMDLRQKSGFLYYF